MRQLLVIITFLPIILSGQSPDSIVYSRDFVLVYLQKNDMNEAKATKAIIADLVKKHQAEQQQIELIRLYKDAYDYKIVDKLVLRKLVDSLETTGMNERVKLFATSSKSFVQFRFVTKKLPDLELPDKNGNLIKLSSLKSKYIVVELWASWCAPCLVDMPKIPALRNVNQNIEFYSISVDKSPEIMNKYVEKYGYNWPIVFGGDKNYNPKLWKDLHIVALPKYFILDKDGIVINVIEKFDEDYIRELK
jgi:thiol-disulfide isomerase/thioredoxin